MAPMGLYSGQTHASERRESLGLTRLEYNTLSCLLKVMPISTLGSYNNKNSETYLKFYTQFFHLAPQGCPIHPKLAGCLCAIAIMFPQYI